MKGERKLSLDVALLASFAALYAVVLKLLPGIPAYGFPGAKIKVAVVLSPIYGFVLGQALAPSSILLGTILAMLIAPSKYTAFSLATVFCAPLGALSAALVFDKRRILGAPKWIYSLAIYLALYAAWILTDVGRGALLYTAPYAVVMGLLIADGAARRSSAERHGRILTMLHLLAGSAAGIFADHFLGSLEAIVVFRYLLESVKPDALTAVYLAAIPVVLVERGLMLLLSLIIVLNLYLVIGKSRYIRVKVD